MTVKQAIDIIGVPSDFGANIRGANMGPSALRVAELGLKLKKLGHEVKDKGNIFTPVRETLAESEVASKFQKTIEKICLELRDSVHDSLQSQRTPIILGGDHSVAIGSIAATARFCQTKQKPMGLLWFDAHADMNTPQTSPSGNIHGMPLAVVLGRGVPALLEIGLNAFPLKAEHVALIGIRSVDEGEKKFCKESGIRCFTMREIDERGIVEVMHEALAITSKNTAGVHLSFDIDCVDPTYIPGVSTPATGGLNLRESHLALEMVTDLVRPIAVDFVELNPMTDVDHKSAEATVELILSAFGKSII